MTNWPRTGYPELVQVAIWQSNCQKNKGSESENSRKLNKKQSLSNRRSRRQKDSMSCFLFSHHTHTKSFHRWRACSTGCCLDLDQGLSLRLWYHLVSSWSWHRWYFVDAKCRTTDVTSWVVLSTISSMAGCFAPKNAPWFVRLARYTALSMMQARASTLKLNSGHLTKKGSYYLMYPFMISSFFFQNLKPTSWRNMTKSNLKASLRLEQEAYLQDNALLALSVCSSPTTSWFSACEHKHTSQSSKIYITWNQKERKSPRDKNGMWNLLVDILKMLCATFSKTFFTSPGVASQRHPPNQRQLEDVTKQPMGPKALMAKCAADQIQSKACKVCFVYVSFFSSYGICREKKG